MNLTKKMLRFSAVAVALALIGSKVMAAVTPLDIPVAEPFETYTNNHPIVLMTGWSSTSEDDISAVTNYPYSFAPEQEGITFPLTAATHTQVMKLNTEGGTLSATLDDEQTGVTYTPLYIDTMVQMVISEDDPSFNNMDDIKIAVFANANSNLVVRHSMCDGVFSFFVTNTVTAVTIDPEKWYRLTISSQQAKIEEEDDGIYTGFRVFLDGQAVTHGNQNWQGLFFAAVHVDVNIGNSERIMAVAFQGTGYIDDLVVTREDPFAPPPLGNVLVYVSVNGVGGSHSLGQNNPWELTKGDNLDIVYTADEWYRIGSLTADDNAVAEAAGAACYTQKLTNVQSDTTNAVTFALATAGQLGVQGGSDAVAWAKGKYANEAAAQAEANLLNNYLANVMGVFGLTISDIGVADNTVTVEVTLSDNVDAPIDTTINGVLVLYGKEDLGDANWSTIAATKVLGAEFVNGKKAYNGFNAGTYKFFKAVIEEDTEIQ